MSSGSNLNPGGYIEIYDPLNPVTCDDGTLPADSSLVKWNDWLVEGSLKLGSPLDSAKDYEKQLADAGFVNITRTDFKWPTNTWPLDRKYKNIGMVNLQSAVVLDS